MRKWTSFSTVILLLTLALQPTYSAESEARAVAEKVVAALSAAWEKRDGVAWGDMFWPDAEFINVFGGVMTGQAEIATTHDRLLKGPLRERRLLMTIRKVRQLAPNVIVLDTHDTDSGGSSNVETRLKLILEQREGQWKVVAAQNTRITEPTF